jgi:hypothetical protein
LLINAFKERKKKIHKERKKERKKELGFLNNKWLHGLLSVACVNAFTEVGPD